MRDRCDVQTTKPPFYLRIWFFFVLLIVGFFGVLATPFSLLLWPTDIVLIIIRIKWSIQRWRRKTNPPKVSPKTETNSISTQTKTSPPEISLESVEAPFSVIPRSDDRGVLKENEATYELSLPKSIESKDDIDATPVDATPYCVFDVETPNHANNRISSIGIIVMQGTKIQNSFHYYIDPEVSFDEFNIGLTGISSAVVSGEPAFPTIWERICPLFENSIVVAHNAIFDLSVLKKTLAAYHINAKPITYLCTETLSRYELTECDNYSLGTLCKNFGIPLQAHQADSDSLACAELLKCFLENGIDVKNYFNTYDFNSKTTIPRKKKTHSKQCQSSKTQTQHELNSLLRRFVAKKNINQADIKEIYSWVQDHTELKKTFPYSQLNKKLSEYSTNKDWNTSELMQIRNFITSLLDPSAQMFDSIQSVDVEGAWICLSGQFKHISREELEQKLIAKGAILKNHIVKNLDYLVVGSLGNERWSEGAYGTKIKTALEYKEKGANIIICKENDFFAALQRDE